MFPDRFLAQSCYYGKANDEILEIGINRLPGLYVGVTDFLARELQNPNTATDDDNENHKNHNDCNKTRDILASCPT